MPLTIGARLGAYEILGALGAGAMSARGHAEAGAEASSLERAGGGAPARVLKC